MKTRCVMALGMFDGVHLGHKKLLRMAADEAKRLHVISVAYTFSNHPKSVFAEDPGLLMAPEEKRRVILTQGIDEVVMVPFDRTLADRTAEDFLAMLLAEYDVACFVAGRDYTFGRGGRGNVDTLKKAARVLVAEDVLLDGEKVSSTRIRAAMESGDTQLVKRLIGQ